MHEAPTGEASHRLVLSGCLNSWTRACLPWWAIGAEMASGQHRLPAYVSARSKAAAGTQDVQLRMRQLARCAWPDGSLRWNRDERPWRRSSLDGRPASPSWPRTLSLRRDLALPLVLLAVQLTGAATTSSLAPVQSAALPRAGGLGAARGRPGGPDRAAPPSGAGAVGDLRHDALAVGHRLDPCELHRRVLRGGHRREALPGLAGAGAHLRLDDLARPARLRVRGPAPTTRCCSRDGCWRWRSRPRRPGSGPSGRPRPEPAVRSTSAASRARSGCGSPGTCTT